MKHVDIGVDLPDEIVHAGEFLLGAEEADHIGQQDLVIEIAVEIQEVDFNLNFGDGMKCGYNPDIHYPGDGGGVQIPLSDHDPIHAVGG